MIITMNEYGIMINLPLPIEISPLDVYLSAEVECKWAICK